MGIPTAIASRNGERRELKHLSTGRKRKHSVMSLLTASERDTAQTEDLTINVVLDWRAASGRSREVSWNGA